MIHELVVKIAAGVIAASVAIGFTVTHIIHNNYPYIKAIAYAEQFDINNKCNNVIIVDYFKPINEKRLFVLDKSSGKVEFSTYVSHGKNSGTEKATKFSNVPGSLASSVGVMKTNEFYVGHSGKSMRLQGLEKGFNDNIRARDIVIHRAKYMAYNRKGSFGHSWGCLAVPPEDIDHLFSLIKPDTLVVVIGAERQWIDKFEWWTLINDSSGTI